LGCNYVFSIGQGLHQIKKVLEKKMIKGTAKREPKKDVCHFVIVLEVLFHKWFPLKGT
jgi:hypothetical protein